VVIPGDIQMIDCIGIGFGTQDESCAPGRSLTFASLVGDSDWLQDIAFKSCVIQPSVFDVESELAIEVRICSFSPRELISGAPSVFNITEADVVCSGHPVDNQHISNPWHIGREHFGAFPCSELELSYFNSCVPEPLTGSRSPHNACNDCLYDMPLVATHSADCSSSETFGFSVEGSIPYFAYDLFNWFGGEPTRFESIVGSSNMVYQLKNHIST